MEHTYICHVYSIVWLKQDGNAMTKQLIGLNKLSNEISLAFTQMQKAKKDYVFSVINLGEKLLKAKDTVGFGKWDEFVNTNSEFAFDVRQAQKYMQIAKHKDLAIALFDGQELRPSVNQITKAISAAKASNRGHPSLPDDGGDAVIEQVTESDHPFPGKGGSEEILEGEFTEIPVRAPEQLEPASSIEQVQPESKAVPEQPEEPIDPDVWRDMVYELQSQVDALAAEIERMRIVFEDDDHIAAAMKEINHLTEDNRVLSERINGLLAEKNEVIKSVRYWKRKAEQLKKQIEEMSHE
jgi:hypothetical protein